MLRHWLTSLSALTCLASGLLFAPAAQATENPGAAALTWAEAHATGHPFMWGGTGPYGYDCSGLVMEAFAHAGIDLPRTTNEMVDSPHLTRTYHPQRGDLAFFGADSHVEIVAERPDTTFGAHDTGSLVGWTGYGGTWVPTAFYRVH